jgi:prepilin-type processing-associated H-X9-DG protein
MAGRSFACTKCGQSFTLSPSGAAFAQQATVGYASAATETKSNPLALASLICGCILCLPFVPGIAAVVTGAIGMRKTRDPAVSGRGFAIAGLVLGILNVVGWGAYFGLIFAIMVPSLGVARQTANQVKCASNLRQIGLALLLYSNENGGAYPDTLDGIILTQDITAGVFVCPSTSHTAAKGNTPQQVVGDMATGGHLSYVYVGKGLTNQAAPRTVVAYEPITDHGTGANFLYADGSVTFLAKAQAEQTIKQLESGVNAGQATAPATAPAEVE